MGKAESDFEFCIFVNLLYKHFPYFKAVMWFTK